MLEVMVFKVKVLLVDEEEVLRGVANTPKFVSSQFTNYYSSSAEVHVFRNRLKFLRVLGKSETSAFEVGGGGEGDAARRDDSLIQMSQGAV